MQTRTKRQREVLEYIVEFIDERGYEPSYQQIARALGVRSKGAIAKHIGALERQGLISRKHEKGTFRIELYPKNSVGNSVARIEWLEIPGESETDEASKEPLLVPNFLLGKSNANQLRAFLAPDDSMVEEQICKGDIVLVENRPFARDRDCVIVYVEEKGALIKKFFRRGADVELRSANSAFDDIVVPADQIEILGVYKGLLRPIS